ncbi:MAG: DUF1016 N-terminal domain-containing protein [Polyangiaceae bacterium]|nr:DUF1016 N-terminal domain-containing protein [Polyangiaceae bacterium]
MPRPKKTATKVRVKNAVVRPDEHAARRMRGRPHPDGASFPVAPPRAELPQGYVETLAEIKQRIQQERLRVVMAANSAMVLLYWDIGRLILVRQEREGWGAKVIDRLSQDLREAYPDMKGFSSRNLLFMRSFAEGCPDAGIVKQLVSQLPWGHIIRLLQRVKDANAREWYMRMAGCDAKALVTGPSRFHDWLLTTRRASDGRSWLSARQTPSAAVGAGSGRRCGRWIAFGP